MPSVRTGVESGARVALHEMPPSSFSARYALCAVRCARTTASVDNETRCLSSHSSTPPEIEMTAAAAASAAAAVSASTGSLASASAGDASASASASASSSVSIAERPTAAVADPAANASSGTLATRVVTVAEIEPEADSSAHAHVHAHASLEPGELPTSPVSMIRAAAPATNSKSAALGPSALLSVVMSFRLLLGWVVVIGWCVA
jgi:hypothetical protein